MKKKTVTINLFWVFFAIVIIATVVWDIKCFKNSEEVRTAVNNYKQLTATVDLDNYSAAIDQIANYPGEEKPTYDCILKSYKDKIAYLKGLEGVKSETLVSETLALREAMEEDIKEIEIYNAWERTYWELPLWANVFIVILLMGLAAYELDLGFNLKWKISLSGSLEEKKLDC